MKDKSLNADFYIGAVKSRNKQLFGVILPVLFEKVILKTKISGIFCIR